MTKPAIVGSLSCQNDSFLRKINTVVVNCMEESSTKYAIELHDTVLFPEGGGQPCDHGTILDNQGIVHRVTEVRRDGLRAVHVLNRALAVGQEVTVELDWRRRLDHMQQHTGQHLLSAVLDKMHLPTLSWNMGTDINYIELPRRLTTGEIEKVSLEVNDLILQAISISVDTPGNNEVNQSKIPEDYDVDKGVLRVVKIGDLDHNPCCGTHLHSTFQIVSVALLHQTAVRGTNSRMHFIAGDRVRQYTVRAHVTLRETASGLSCAVGEIAEKVEGLSLGLKTANKQLGLWKEEVAIIQAEHILKDLELKDTVAVYRGDVGLEYLTLVSRLIQKKLPAGKTLVLMAGEGASGGAVIIQSYDAARSSAISKELQTVIPGLRGGGKAKWQGKITGFGKGELETALNYLNSL